MEKFTRFLQTSRFGFADNHHEEHEEREGSEDETLDAIF